MEIKQKTHIYFIPGMAAGPKTFENIKLPEDQYEVKIIEWLIPEKDETLTQYAKRMAAFVKTPDAILVGVSFGGVVAQEMERFLKLKRLVIISSVKNKNELPWRMRLTGQFKAYKLIPTAKFLSVKDLTQFSVGPKSKRRLLLYQKYLNVRNKQYLDWAIKQMVTWDREKTVEGLIHIHGEKDQVFPIKYIKKCIVIKEGTHIMLLTRGREISQLLQQIAEQKIEKTRL